MVKDRDYLRILNYLGKPEYREMWEKNEYGSFSKFQINRIKNYWETFEYFNPRK